VWSVGLRLSAIMRGEIDDDQPGRAENYVRGADRRETDAKDICVTQSHVQIPRFPALLAVPLRALPLAPLSALLTAYSGKVAKNHPDLFRRLGDYSHTK